MSEWAILTSARCIKFAVRVYVQAAIPESAVWKVAEMSNRKFNCKIELKLHSRKLTCK